MVCDSTFPPKIVGARESQPKRLTSISHSRVNCSVSAISSFRRFAPGELLTLHPWRGTRSQTSVDGRQRLRNQSFGSVRAAMEETRGAA